MVAVSSDLNLLFGMLALQLDFITKDQLLAGLHAWLLDKSQSIGDILVAQKVLNQDRRQLLGTLVQKHLDAHDNDVHQSLAALSTRNSAHDSLGELNDDDIHATINHVKELRAAKPDMYGTVAPEFDATAVRFRILRPHAEGGLGVVYVARDEEIGREVALKEIQSHRAHEPDSRARFILEAEITGGLEHPGIVPVYGLGHYPDGRPYYAMRFIRGESLKEATDRYHAGARSQSPTERQHALRHLLRRFIDVCNAIEYAHCKGVLHRDLKPGNIMLGKFGETLVVDWGLAKATGKTEVHFSAENSEAPLAPTSGSGATPTLMGCAVGTPAFMSPEQAAGRLDLLGPASDIYSLGATLYFVLTGKPAFAQKSFPQIAEKVQRGEFCRPRQVDAKVPAALEAVCLKAMALNPKDRYATADALRQDVDNWIEDVPVSAWREPLRARARRWLNRHRVAAGMGAAAIAMAIVSLAIATVFLSKINDELVDAHANETRERRRAEDHVVALFMERGQQAAQQDDRFLAALGYVEAIAREADPNKQQRHRTMLAALLDGTPMLEWMAELKAPIRHASFSPDGKRIVVAGADGVARLLRRDDGVLVGESMVHNGPITCTAFSPDGKSVATASADRTARIWDSESGRPITEPILHPGSVAQVQFDQTGKKLLTASASSAPLLWDASTGRALFDKTQPIRTPGGEGNGAAPLILEPGQPTLLQAEFVGDQIATLSDASVLRIVSTSNPYGVPLFDERIHPRAIHFCFDGERKALFVACENGDVRMLIDLDGASAPKDTILLHQHDDGATVVAVSPNGKRLASGGSNRNGVLGPTPIIPLVAPTPEKQSRMSQSAQEFAFAESGPQATSGPSPVDPPKTAQSSSDKPPAKIEMESPKVAPKGPEIPPPSGVKAPPTKGNLKVNPPITSDPKIPSQPKRSDPPPLARPIVGQPPKDNPPLRFSPKVTPGMPPKVIGPPVTKPLSTAPIKSPVLKPPAGQPNIPNALSAPPPSQPPAPVQPPSPVPGPAAAQSDGVFRSSFRPGEHPWRAPGTRSARDDHLLPHNHAVHRVAFDRRGQYLLTASEDQTARIWNADSGEPVTPPLRHDAAVRFAAWSPDSACILTCGEDGRVRLWSIRQLSTSPSIARHQSEVNVVAFTKSGDKYIAATDDGSVTLRDVRTGEPVGPVYKHPDIVWMALFDKSERRIATCCLDRNIRIWNIGNAEPKSVIPLGGGVVDMVLSGDGQMLLVGCDDGALSLIDLETGKPLLERREGDADKAGNLKSEYQGRLRVAIDATASRFISGGMGRIIKIWDARTGAVLRQVTTDNRAIHDLKMSPDGRRCVAAGTDGARVYDLDTGRPLTPPMRQSGNIYAAVFSPDGSKIATAGSDGVARIWDSATGRPLSPPLHHERYVHAVRFSGNGNLLLTACATYARVWDVASGEPLSPPFRHGGDEVPSAAINAAGTRVVTAGRDGTSRIWPLPAPDSRSIDDLRADVSRLACLYYSSGCQLMPASEVEPVAATNP